MKETSARYRTGAKIFSEVYPWSPSEEPSEFEGVMIEQLFAEVWSRPGLTTRERRLLILGVAAAQGNDRILRVQMESGLAKGDLVEDDLIEVPIFLTQYVGWPLGVVTNTIARKVLKEHK